MKRSRLLSKLRKALQQAGDPARAPAMQAYMKSATPYHGVPTPLLRRVCKATFADVQLSSASRVLAKSCERLVNLLHAGRPFADRSSDPFHAATTYIADRIDSRNIRLKGVGRTFIAPSVAR